MAKFTPHSALEGLGFKLVRKHFNGIDHRTGDSNTYHYTKTTNSVGNGNVVRPITHHIFVDEFSKRPNKYNVAYQLMQDGKQYAGGDLDVFHQHKDHVLGGFPDPVSSIMEHHRGVVDSLAQMKADPLTHLSPGELNPHKPYHWTPAWGDDDPKMKGQTRLISGPDLDKAKMIHLNSTQDQPLDLHVHRRLTGGAKGRPRFEYMGRIAPGDSDTDVYHAAYQDPEDPYMRYGFTVRHMPSATSSPVQDYRGETDPLLPKPLPFSYSVTHYPVDILDEGGDYPIGDFMHIGEYGDQAPVANFTDVGPLIERHHNVLRSVGLMDLPSRESRPAWQHNSSVVKTADEFDDIVSGAGSAGPCWACGKATYNREEGRSLQSNSSVPLRASDETGGEMHGPDINLCGDCSGDDMNYHMAVTHASRGPNKLWHWNDQGVRGCPDCEAHLMDQADEDLRP